MPKLLNYSTKNIITKMNANLDLNNKYFYQKRKKLKNPLWKTKLI